MKRTLVLDVAGLGADLVAEMPALERLAGRGALVPLEPILPATTCPMQATLTTGEPPARHGIISSGLYFHDTAEVRFWEQSARLVLTPRVWDVPLRIADCGLKKRRKSRIRLIRNPKSEIRNGRSPCSSGSIACMGRPTWC